MTQIIINGVVDIMDRLMRMGSRMALEGGAGTIVLFMKDSGFKANSMGLEGKYLVMEVPTLENFKIGIETAEVFIQNSTRCEFKEASGKMTSF